MKRDQWLKQAKPYETDGEFFKAYDTLVRGLEAVPGDPWLAHRAVLCLANAGATGLARRKFDELGLAGHRETDIVALDGRLSKDAAFAGDGAERMALLAKAAETYGRAYEAAARAGDPDAYYPAINVATLRLLRGETDAAIATAREVLQLLAPRMERTDFADSADRYWILATAIEANLIVGDMGRAKELADAALDANAGQHLALASTARQLRLVLSAKGEDPSWLGGFAPPEVIHYTGHMIAPPGREGRFAAEEEPRVAEAIAAALSERRIGTAYGSLAAGADILFAEALLAQGASLNLVFPFALDDFLEQSVKPFGEGWAARFQTCFDRASTVRFATDDQYLGDDRLYVYCSELAMGLATLCARHMGAEVRQMAVWDGRKPSGVAGTAVDMTLWRRKGRGQTVIRCGSGPDESLPEQGRRASAGVGRDARAMLFGDIKGFSKLTDRQIPIFRSEVMAALGGVIDGLGSEVALRNTWGDGLFLVFEDAGVAARASLSLQQAVSAIDMAAVGLPEGMALRLGGHVGPVYEIDDPILHQRNYFGAHVSRAARIEPITPEGCVYVTETFAAVLALYNADEFACDYVGITEMAKHYGQLRMFLLRRAKAGAGPMTLREVR